jgi:TolB-like protein
MQEAKRQTPDPSRQMAPSPEAAREQLARIVASPDFAASDRVRRFLRYVVEETLAGRADRLKGYSIGLAVFDRDESFDSQADPVVRIEAGRLRRALERYYLLCGQDDPILIEIPKGTYVPIFRYRFTPPLAPVTPEAAALPPMVAPAPLATGNPPPVGATQGLPSIFRRYAFASVLTAVVALAVVLTILHMRFDDPFPAVADATPPAGASLLVIPFADLSDGDEARLYAAGLAEEVLTQLARFKELRVFGRETTWSVPTAADTDGRSIARQLGARYLLAGSLRTSGRQLRVTSRLVDASSGVVLWAQTYEEDLQAKGLLATQEDIARQVVDTLAQPSGAVFRADLQQAAAVPPDDLEAYSCTLRFYVYRAELSPEQHGAVRTCLQRAVARFPNYSTAWAMLSLLALDEDRFAFNPEPGQPPAVERALAAARRAVGIDPQNARALQALMMALFFHGDVEEARSVGERALAYNPNDSELLSEFGLRVALAGEWQRGRALVEEALSRNPGYSGYYHAVLALIAYMQRDDDRALAEIRQANLDKFSIYHAVAAVIYVEHGLMAEAREAAARFVELHPTFARNLDAELARRNVRREDRARLIEGLRAAGLVEPGTAAAIVRVPGPS